MCKLSRLTMTLAGVAGMTLVLSPAVLSQQRGNSKRPPAESRVFATSEGPVRGFVKDGVWRFLGIPYAAPPVGELRWRPPQRHARWRTPLQAVAFGNTCAQINTLGVFAAPSIHEDCLFLNVFTQAGKQDDEKDGKQHGEQKKNGEDGQQGRPVMVWFHGGGNFDGESNDYDGSKLAKDGTVVVTLNYRLNIFGFFAHPALDNEGHAAGNYGIMDQQFALQWVQRNIKAFGGDPHNVTIFGESAGGVDVIANLASPVSRGLFHGGILESGALTSTTSLAAAEAIGRGFAAAVGCADVTCLRSLSVRDILAKSDAFRSGQTGTIVDGTIIPQSIETAFATGQFNRVPIINGTNRDEFTFFIPVPDFGGGEVQAGTYPARVAASFGANAPAVLTHYPLSNFGSASEALAAAISDQLIACPARQLDRGLSKFVPVYAYEFADRTAPSFAPLASFPYGAAHTFEIQYLFPLYHGGLGTPHALNAAQSRLSDQMVSYWTEFAKDKNPNSHATPDWAKYDPRQDKFQSLNIPNPAPITTFAAEHQCDFWASLQ